MKLLAKNNNFFFIHNVYIIACQHPLKMFKNKISKTQNDKKLLKCLLRQLKQINSKQMILNQLHTRIVGEH